MYIFQMIDGLSTGGAEQLQVTFAKEAKRRGFKLAVISLGEDDDSQYVRQIRALDVPVHFFPTNRIFNFNNLYRIEKLLLKERPDIIHANLTYANIIGSLTASLARIPIVTTLHSTGVDERFRAPRTEQVEKFVLRHLVNKIVACGPAVANYYRKTVKDEPVLVIPNAVDSLPQISSFERDALRKQVAGDVERPIIISVGRMVVHKGFEDLVEAFSVVHSSYPAAFLAIVGDCNNDGYRNILEQKIKDLQLSDHVGLLGWRTDVPSLLLASDMFVLASHWEGLPIAVLEAMNAGLPIVATDVGDNAWAIDATGLIVPPRQPGELAVAIEKLLDDPVRSRALGQAARTRIEKSFNPSVWFDEIISVYQRLLN